MKKNVVTYLLQITLLSLIYFFTAKFGLKQHAVSGFATLVWLPSGISLAALLLFGFRLWPALFIGAFFANYFNQAPPLVAEGIACGNVLEAVTGYYLLKHIIGFKNMFDRLRDVLGIITVSVFCTMLSASVGVLSLLLGHVIQFPAIADTWSAWWVGDMISILIITPLILVWSHRSIIKIKSWRIVELYLFFFSLTIISLVVFGGLLGIQVTNSPIIYLVFPPLILISLRFSQREAITATALLSTIAIWGTSLGLGPFIGPSPGESLFYLQSFMGTVTATIMILAVVFQERRQLEKHKDEFIGIASHELKTPITSIKAYSQLLTKMFTKKKEKQASLYLNQMNKQINKLTNLVDDLLDLSKIEAGKLEYRKELFSLQKLVQETIETIQQISKKHTIILKGSVRKKMYGDRERIEQVLINLLLNAIKYSPHSQKVIVTITNSKDKTTVTVKDFGVGIAAQYYEKIFEHFYRVADDKTQKISGFGIGLYISRDIIRYHGGDLWLKSEVGKGSEFSFSLPFSKK